LSCGGKKKKIVHCFKGEEVGRKEKVNCPPNSKERKKKSAHQPPANMTKKHSSTILLFTILMLCTEAQILQNLGFSEEMPDISTPVTIWLHLVDLCPT
jgi:hypothetical protein